MNSNNILKIAIQKSGRLSEQSIELLKKCGLEFEISERKLMTRCANFPLEILFFRTNDIPEIVSDNTVECGICGQNSIAEKGFNLIESQKLGFGNCRLSIAIPEKSAKSFSLQNKNRRMLRFDNPRLKPGVTFSLENKKIATSYPNILRKYLKENQIKAEIIELSGSVEIAPKLKIADAIFDSVATGNTLESNNLKEFEQIFYSEAVLVTRKDLPKNKKELLEKLLLRIKTVLMAQKYKYILMNAPVKSVEKIKKIVPGLKNPTISPLSDKNYVSIASVVEEDKFWETIEKLKDCGASGIIVQPIEKMIL